MHLDFFIANSVSYAYFKERITDMFDRIHNKECTTYSKNRLQNEIDVEQIIDEMTPLINKRLNHFSVHPSDKEDLCQEVLLKLYSVLSRFDFTEATPLEHYVNCVIKNVKNDYIRKKMYTQRRQEVLVNEFIVTYNNSKSEQPIDRYIIAREISSQLKQCLKRLTDLEQRIISYILIDYKPQEIAQILNLNTKVVYNAIHRCKIKIRRCLEK